MTLSPAGLAAAYAMSEDDLLAAVLGTSKHPGIARVRGWLGHHETDSRKTAAGWPDLVLIRGERLVVAELKREDPRLGAVTAPQREWLHAFEVLAEALLVAQYASGGYADDADPFLEVHLWRPSDLIAGRIATVLR